MSSNNEVVISCYSGKPLYILCFQYTDRQMSKHINIGLININLNTDNVIITPTDGQNIDLDIFLIYGTSGHLVVGDTRSSRVIIKEKINKNNLSKIPEEVSKIFSEPNAYKLYGGELNRAFSDLIKNLK